MAAEIIEQAELAAGETQDLPTDEQALSQEDLVADLNPPEPTPGAEPQAEDDIPEKYRGKSMKEIVAMHQEAEKLIGKQGGEVGELRQVVDQFIQSQTPVQQTPEPEAAEEVDFFEDPQKAVSNAISQHPEVKAARDAANELKRASSLQQLQGRHPDAAQVINTPAFVEWVKGSPIRVELFSRADQGYDFAAADELLTTFKERTQVARDTAAAEATQRKQEVSRASTGGGSAANTAGSKRVYRRADIIKLMKTDPDRYEQLSPEIMQAYAEGRVR